MSDWFSVQNANSWKKNHRKKKLDTRAECTLDTGNCKFVRKSCQRLPRFMKGIVKSTTCSRSYVMVKSATAKSALCEKICIRCPYSLVVEFFIVFTGDDN